MKISIFRIQLFSDIVTFRSYGLCQRAGRVGVDPQTNFIEKAGRVEKTVQPPQPPPGTKILATALGRDGEGRDTPAHFLAASAAYAIDGTRRTDMVVAGH